MNSFILTFSPKSFSTLRTATSLSFNYHCPISPPLRRTPDPSFHKYLILSQSSSLIPDLTDVLILSCRKYLKYSFYFQLFLWLTYFQPFFHVGNIWNTWSLLPYSSWWSELPIFITCKVDRYVPFVDEPFRKTKIFY